MSQLKPGQKLQKILTYINVSTFWYYCLAHHLECYVKYCNARKRGFATVVGIVSTKVEGWFSLQDKSSLTRCIFQKQSTYGPFLVERCFHSYTNDFVGKIKTRLFNIINICFSFSFPFQSVCFFLPSFHSF